MHKTPVSNPFIVLTAAALLSMVSCAKVGIVDPEAEQQLKPIGFSVLESNMTKAALNDKGHYNFGVFAYKNTDATNNVMSNYLVGYQDAANKKGYSMSASSQTTLGDAPGSANGESMWQYEKLGSDEYTYTGSDGYYTKTQTAYMSNNANQYLRFWDYSSSSTVFYAYAPYINGTGTASFNNSNKTLTIPDGSIEHAFVENGATSDHCDYLYAATSVPTAQYNTDVPLAFKRLNAKVNIKFWEDIEGYSVQIINLTSGTGAYGVSAAPSIKTAQGTVPETYSYTQGSYYSKSGVAIDFSDPANPVVAQATGTTTDAALKFTVPADAAIGTTKSAASASPTTYYAIPKTNTTGFTFHVSYELTSTTGEKIKVQDATVYVPVDNTNWVANNAYTYIFKITKGSTGTTGDPGTINPNDPEPKPTPALYPIVFDGCTVVDYTSVDTDHLIN